MDRSRKSPPRRKKIITSLIVILVIAGSWMAYQFGGDRSLDVDRDRLTIATVTNDSFYEYINLSGRVEPNGVYYIDSKVAGNVERIFAESGQEVAPGDTLLLVSNADLELEVMQRESQLIEQLNAQRQTRLLLNQNDFTRREQVVEINYQLALQEKQFRRDTQLLAEGLLAAQDYEPTANRYAYFQKRRELLAASFRQDSIVRRSQLAQLDAFENRILTNLRQVRAILDRLYVRAATPGRLSDFSVRAGQAVTDGQRLGEIYQMTEPLLVAEVDEFYLDRISVGQRGIVLDRGDTVRLTVAKIYPNVEGGRFRIDMQLKDAPVGLFTKGQSVRVRLLFGQASPTTLLAAGNFYGSSGGHWVYRIDGDRAIKTPVRLGRSNPNYYEVLEGLVPGDRVVISDYASFDDYPNIKLN